MKNKGTQYLIRKIKFCVPLFLVILISAVAQATLPVSIDQISSVIPQAASYEHRTAPLDHYRVYDNEGRLIGVAFVTSAIPPVVRGYRDEIDVLVGMDIAGRVTGVEILAHREDPAYVHQLISRGFLERFVGRTIEQGFDDIEAVTGATISSNAVKRDIQTAAFEIHQKLIDGGIVDKGLRRTPSPFDLISTAAIVALMAGAALAIAMPRRRWIRITVWLTSLAVIGIWLNVPITIGTFVDLGHASVPTHFALLILMIFALAAALIKGNLYCAYLCPFGALQEGAARIGVPKCRPSADVERSASWLRWIVLMAAVFGITAGVFAFRVIEPFSRLFARSIDVAVYVQTAIVLVAALFIRRPWCKYFCPTGAVLDLICLAGSKVRIAFKHKRNRKDEPAHS